MPRQDKSRSWSNGAETCHRARNHAEHGRLAARPPFQRHPCHSASRCGKVGGYDCENRTRVGCERRAAIESEPADPQHAGADYRQRKVEWREIIAPVAVPCTNDVGRDEAGDAGVEMHNGTTGEIEEAGAGKKTAAPDPMRDRNVYNDEPQCRE